MKFKDFISYLKNNDNLTISSKDLDLLGTFEGKTGGIIGLREQNLPPELYSLPYNPDLFDLKSQYSNLENIIPEIENRYDYLILVTNKDQIVTLDIPVIKLIKKDLILEIQGPNTKIEIEDWLDEINLSRNSIKYILKDQKVHYDLSLLESSEIKDLDYLSHYEKNSSILEEAVIDNNHYYLFQVLENKMIQGHFYLAHLNNDLPEYFTIDLIESINRSNVIFIENKLPSLKNEQIFKNKEIVFFSKDTINKVLTKIQELLTRDDQVLLIYSDLLEDLEKFINQLIPSKEQLTLIPTISLPELMRSVFSIIEMDDYIKLRFDSDSKDRLTEKISNCKQLEIPILLELKDFNNSEETNLVIWLKEIFDPEQYIGSIDLSTNLGILTKLEYFEYSNEYNNIIIFPQGTNELKSGVLKLSHD